MPGGSVLAWCWAWVVVISRGMSSAGVFLFDVARALRHGLLIPVMLSGRVAAVAMEWWECCLVCACGVVIGWKARGVLQAEASGSKAEPPSSEWASEIGAFWDPQAEVTWMISISELSFACEEQNKIIKARVCGGELAVHFRTEDNYGKVRAAWVSQVGPGGGWRWHAAEAVSYTHLTLPTKLEV